MDDSVNSFKISSSHKSFTDKQNSLFSHLDEAAKTNKLSMEPEAVMEVDIKLNRQILKSKTKHFKSRESIFKRPEAPISKCLPLRKTPNFRNNPNKWKKYSLHDVEEISDRSNTTAALSFLKELEDRHNPIIEEKLDSLPEKIVFKKSAIAKKNINDNECDDPKISFSSSKVVMPEYVIGKKVKKEKKPKKDGEKSNKELKLGHLYEEND